jgi:hypothetical protein
MAENVNVFNFRLSEVDMRELVKLDKAESLFFRPLLRKRLSQRGPHRFAHKGGLGLER